MCEGAIGLSAGLFYAPQNFAKTDEVIALAKEAGARGGIYDTHQRDESSYSIGLMASTKEVLQIGREGHIPVHYLPYQGAGPRRVGQVRRCHQADRRCPRQRARTSPPTIIPGWPPIPAWMRR